MGRNKANMKLLGAIACLYVINANPFTTKQKSNDVLSQSDRLRLLQNYVDSNAKPVTERSVKGWFDTTVAPDGPAATTKAPHCPQMTNGEKYCFDPAVLDSNYLTTVDSWGEFYERMEARLDELPDKTEQQEEANDALEACVSKCKRKDRKWDFSSKHEEKSAEYNKNGVGFKPIACVDCVQKIPDIPETNQLLNKVTGVINLLDKFGIV